MEDRSDENVSGLIRSLKICSNALITNLGDEQASAQLNLLFQANSDDDAELNANFKKAMSYLEPQQLLVIQKKWRAFQDELFKTIQASKKSGNIPFFQHGDIAKCMLFYMSARY